MKIEIEYSEKYLWTVTAGDRKATHLGWDEMLGLIAQLTKDYGTKCLGWLKSAPDELEFLLLDFDDIKSIEDKL